MVWNRRRPIPVSHVESSFDFFEDMWPPRSKWDLGGTWFSQGSLFTAGKARGLLSPRCRSYALFVRHRDAAGRNPALLRHQRPISTKLLPSQCRRRGRHPVRMGGSRTIAALRFLISSRRLSENFRAPDTDPSTISVPMMSPVIQGSAAQPQFC